MRKKEANSILSEHLAGEKGLSLKLVKLETLEQAQASLTPATIFSLFRNGRFMTIDLSVCMDNRFEKVLKMAD